MSTTRKVEENEIGSLDLERYSLNIGIRTMDGHQGPWLGLTLSEWRTVKESLAPYVTESEALRLLTKFADAAIRHLSTTDHAASQ